MRHAVRLLVLGEISRLAEAPTAARLVAYEGPLAGVDALVLQKVATLHKDLRARERSGTR